MTLKNALKNPWVIIVIFGVLILFSSLPSFELYKLGFLSKNSLWFGLLNTTTALVVMLCLPLLIINRIYKEKISDFGFKIPENGSRWVETTATVTILFLIIIYFLSKTDSFQSYYLITHKITWLFSFEIILSLIYFISEEFFFRGFLFFTLIDKIGYNSFWVTNLFFALLHLGKANGEFFVSLLGGLVLSVLSYRTKSFIPAVIVHFIAALALNLAILYLN